MFQSASRPTVGRSWGGLPKSKQARWATLECDSHAAAMARLEGGKRWQDYKRWNRAKAAAVGARQAPPPNRQRRRRRPMPAVAMEHVRRRRGGPRLTVCSGINRENLWAREWVDHYLRMGFQKIVLYSDLVDDQAGLRAKLGDHIRSGAVDLISVFPKYLLEHDAQLYAGVPRTKMNDKWRINDCARWIAAGRKGKYGYSSRCQSALNYDCLARYGPHSDWLTNLDMDEFVFPCNPAVANVSALMTGALADNYRMQCLRFGTSGAKVEPQEPVSVLATHTHRAPYAFLGDPGATKESLDECNRLTIAEAAARGHPLQHSARGGLCETLGWSCKHLSRARMIQSFGKNVHKVHMRQGAKEVGYNKTHYGLGLCCNHYQMRNEQEALEKDRRNGNFVYTATVHSPTAMAHFNTVEDKSILARLP